MEITNTIPIVSAVSTIGLILFLAWKESRSGARQITTEVVTNYKILIEQQKEQLFEMHDMEKRLSVRIANLEGQLKVKDQHIIELQNTVLNRNPELEAVLREIRDFMKQLNEQNINQTAILEEGAVRGKHQVAMIESQLKREKSIDKNTSDEEGNIMRKK